MLTKRLPKHTTNAAQGRGLVACACCSTLHDPRFCSQCIAAGCNHKAASEKCRLGKGIASLMDMPETVLREKYAALVDEHNKVVAEAQRLARLVMLYEQGGKPVSGSIPTEERVNVS